MGVLSVARCDYGKDLVSNGAGDAEANMPLGRDGQYDGLVPYHLLLNEQSHKVKSMER